MPLFKSMASISHAANAFCVFLQEIIDKVKLPMHLNTLLTCDLQPSN